MLDILSTIGRYVVEPAILFTIFAFVARAIINRYMDKRVDLYREQLRRETLEFQTKLVQLHTERALVIKALYSLTSKVSRQASEAIDTLDEYNHKRVDRSEIKKLKTDLREMADELVDNYDRNKIYFKRAVSDQIEAVVRQLDLIVDFMKDMIDLAEGSSAEETLINKIIEESKKASPNLVQLVKEMEDEFRKLLGVDE